MKHELLTIGEASALKGVSPKSLRYYERIGILEPAVVDPQTGYRYYGMNQMLDLDVIITCIELGIPLKTLVEYKNVGGSLDIASLLERGRATALERIRKASARLAQIDSCLREIEQQKALKAQAGGYTRRLGARPIMYAPWPGDAFDAKRYLSLTAGLYAYAAHEGAVPLYLWGMAREPPARRRAMAGVRRDSSRGGGIRCGGGRRDAERRRRNANGRRGFRPSMPTRLSSAPGHRARTERNERGIHARVRQCDARRPPRIRRGDARRRRIPRTAPTGKRVRALLPRRVRAGSGNRRSGRGHRDMGCRDRREQIRGRTAREVRGVAGHARRTGGTDRSPDDGRCGPVRAPETARTRTRTCAIRGLAVLYGV